MQDLSRVGGGGVKETTFVIIQVQLKVYLKYLFVYETEKKKHNVV